MIINEYTAKDLAYIDSFCGLIPCKVRAIFEDSRQVNVIVTVNRSGYKKGEIIISTFDRIIPRKQVYTKNSQFYIHTNYVWKG